MNMLGGNTAIIKKVNTSLIRQTLISSRQATTQQLAGMTGLSLMTVGNILQHLQQEGEVLPGELIPSAGGRPSRLYRYNPDSSLILGIYSISDKQGAEVCLCIANAFNEVIYTDSQIYKTARPESFFSQIDRALKKYPSIRAMGFGVPGVIREGRILSCDFSEQTDCNFEQLYRDRYELPIILDNDANCVVAGYCTGKDLSRESAIVALYFPKICALGAGIWIGDSVYRGARNYAGELANLPFGIDWGNDPTLYENPERLSTAIAKLTDVLCCVLDPQEIVLYGQFLTEGHLSMIKDKCLPQIRESGIPELVLSQNFENDYRAGILYETRNLLKPTFELQKN